MHAHPGPSSHRGDPRLKRVAIVQSNYIPWKGYFDLIASVDEFILYDDAQYTRRDWRNRNLIKTPAGTKWLTIPVEVRGKFDQPIRETRINGEWAESHWRSLKLNYAHADCYDEVAATIEGLYGRCTGLDTLSEVNAAFLAAICRYLGITTKITRSWDYDLPEGRNERLIAMAEQSGASVYVSGPAARGYLDETLFDAVNISVEWFDYAGYPEYPQLWGPFEHGVTVLDLIFNCGPAAPRYMKFGRS